MNDLVERKMPELVSLCRKHQVSRLALFGSATTGRFRHGSSDLDFLVEFEPMPPVRHADSYFGLLQDLEDLFGVAIDLVEPGPIRNPYFREAIDRTKQILYEAA